MTRPDPPTETLRDALDRASAALLAADAPALAPAAFAALSVHRPSSGMRRLPRIGRRLSWVGAAFAGAALVLALVLITVPGPGTDDGLAGMQASAGQSTAFLPVSSSEQWPQLMQDASRRGRAWVVSTELPRESLASMGLPYDPSRAGEPVRAELLVHASGDVLAVRFVR
jgi:hypothetical protein